MADDNKRRLPVLQPREDEDEPRPPWHWSVIGGVAMLIAATPLGMLASWWAKASVERALSGAEGAEARTAAWQALSPIHRSALALLSVGAPLVALGIGALLGGVLVGRFGGDAGKKEATVGGVGAGAVVALFAAVDAIRQGGVGAWTMSAVLVVAVAALAARGGAVLGLFLRRRSFSR